MRPRHLCNWLCSPRRTVFLIHEKLKPGYFKLSLKKQLAYTQQYWNVYDAYNKPALKLTCPKPSAKRKNCLPKAFPSTGWWWCRWVFLSGGYDSSLLLPRCKKTILKKSKHLPLVFPMRAQWSAVRKRYRRHLGTDHTEYYCTEKKRWNRARTALFYDEPLLTAAPYPHHWWVKLQGKSTVGLIGWCRRWDFAGYNRYDYIWSLVKDPPDTGFYAKSAAAVMDVVPLTPFRCSIKIFIQPLRKSKTLFKILPNRMLMSPAKWWMNQINRPVQE